MRRTNIIELKPDKLQKQILKECMLLSSCVFNSANYICRQKIIKGEKVPDYYTIKQQIQETEDYKLLGRVYGSPKLQKFSEINSTRFKLIKSRTQKKVGLIKYYKNRKTNTTIPSALFIDNCQYSIHKNYVQIPLSFAMRKKYAINKATKRGMPQFKIKYDGTLKWQGKQCRSEIHERNGKFYLHQIIELETPKLKESKNIIGIDLGIKKLIALYINNGEGKVIGSKRHFKQWQHYENLIAKEKSHLTTINKLISNKLNRLYLKRSKWQNNLYNNLVSKLFKILKRNKVTQIYIGDVKGITQTNKGRKSNQMINNYWSFDRLYQKIQNKAEENGIAINRITEEYTSRTCPICLDDSKSNCKDRIFLCDFCGYVDHRDIIGARNIMFKGMYGLQSIHRQEILPSGMSE